MDQRRYEAVIGLEVHAELKTASKIFCSCRTDFGAPPNTQCCPICMGLPGALPALNRRAMELAILAGLALDAEIAERMRFDRKQYAYPDLPKAYQISQDKYPLCKNGRLRIRTEEGEREIRILRLHVEEDAGKLIHGEDGTLVDHNRSGVGLIEIVSAPELHTAEEVSAYLRALRGVLQTVGVSDCRMQEGSMRCDVNLSLRRRGEDTLGVRTEIKNLNSFSFAEKAVRYEIERQTALLEAGERVESETRRYNEATGRTDLMRRKERSEDYRFLPEVNLPVLRISREELDRMRKTLPELPQDREKRLVKTYGVPTGEAELLCTDPALADYFEAAAKQTAYPVRLCHLLLSELLRHCSSEPFSSPVRPARLAELAELLGEGSINGTTAKSLLARMLREDLSPRSVAEEEGLLQIRDPEILAEMAEAVLRENAGAVRDYRSGKTAALRALQGRLMAKSGGRADPVLGERLLLSMLSASPSEE